MFSRHFLVASLVVAMSAMSASVQAQDAVARKPANPLKALFEVVNSFTAPAEEAPEEAPAPPVAKPAVQLLPVAPAAPQQPADIDEVATHADSRKIEVKGVNAFCLNAKGEILAACGVGPGEVRLLNAKGEEIRSWEVDFKPEAINVTPEGNVLVAGAGKLASFSIEGKLLNSAPSPQAKAIRSTEGSVREQAVNSLKRVVNPSVIENQINYYKKFVEQLETKQANGELNTQEELALETFPQRIEAMEASLEAAKKRAAETPEPSEEQIQAYIERIFASKMRVASVSTDGKSVFIATPASEGYGYSVWKMNPDFTAGEEIVTGLRGCCGQMDVQCCENGIYVAENSRHRVVRYSKEGKEELTWGQRDRTGMDGFTSCCNPMNVCFGSTGDVYTAESNTGRIKRFNKDGEFISFVGDVKLVPGCKNVSIAVAPGGDEVYMLDITRGHIVVMTKSPEKEKIADEAADVEKAAAVEPTSTTK